MPKHLQSPSVGQRFKFAPEHKKNDANDSDSGQNESVRLGNECCLVDQRWVLMDKWIRRVARSGKDRVSDKHTLTYWLPEASLFTCRDEVGQFCCVV
jgi:hypothetical protein